MLLYKRGKTWHTDFSVSGQRFRRLKFCKLLKITQSLRPSVCRTAPADSVLESINISHAGATGLPRFPPGAETRDRRAAESKNRVRLGDLTC